MCLMVYWVMCLEVCRRMYLVMYIMDIMHPNRSQNVQNALDWRWMILPKTADYTHAHKTIFASGGIGENKICDRRAARNNGCEFPILMRALKQCWYE